MVDMYLYDSEMLYGLLCETYLYSGMPKSEHPKSELRQNPNDRSF